MGLSSGKRGLWWAGRQPCLDLLTAAGPRDGPGPRTCQACLRLCAHRGTVHAPLGPSLTTVLSGLCSETHFGESGSPAQVGGAPAFRTPRQAQSHHKGTRGPIHGGRGAEPLCQQRQGHLIRASRGPQPGLPTRQAGPGPRNHHHQGKTAAYQNTLF